ncbi:MAG: hypothetical protein K2Z81_28340, partial [Cyanobacteria bacterium]|nr:hypothetical protein [Cyanobacteriota bacterium]
MRTPQYSILSLMLSLIMFGGTQPTIAAGNGKVLEGSVKEEHKGNVLNGSTTRTGKVLEGSIKDEATLHPSLKVIPSVPGITQPGSRYTGEVTQYRGSKSNFPSMRPA